MLDRPDAPMCFIVFAYQQHPRYRLVMATNRDEFYERPTAPAAFWEDHPEVLAGRDLKAGGTWMGVTRSGRIAALTNYREPAAEQADSPSRGGLVADYLRGDADPRAYLEALRPAAGRYNGFNLLVGDLDGLYYFSNREGNIQALSPGLYGLSNHLLDTPWPKIIRGKEYLRQVLSDPVPEAQAIFSFLHDEAQATDGRLPDTGVGKKWERVLSSIFIASPRYGTRASTLVCLDAEGRMRFTERTFPPPASEEDPFTRHFTFHVADEV